MKKNNKKIIVCIALFLCFLVFGIWSLKQETNQMGNETTKNGKNIQTVSVSKLYPSRTLEQMIEESSLVTEGKVVDISEPFVITPTNGGSASNFIDYVIEPLEVYRSHTDNLGGEITVRLQGGLLGETNVICEDAPVLEQNKIYTFFLYQPGTGGFYNTEGDYYYPLGGKNSVYSKIDEATMKSQYGEVLSIADFQQAVSAVNAVSTAPDKAEAGELFYEHLDGQLEDGSLSQEDYAATVEQFQEYAQIINP